MTKKILLTILIGLYGVSLTYAQQERISFSKIIAEYNDGIVSVDEAYNKMIIELEKPGIIKCSTPVYMFAHKHQAVLTNSTAHLRNRLKNNSVSESYTSPTGKFKLVYETTGSNAVPSGDENSNGIPDYVEWTAQAADSSYNYLVGTLGFSDPIPVGSVYEVFFEDLNGTYGVTYTYNNPGGPGTKIVMENDFAGFPDNLDPDGSQRGAIRATMAHEFKHAIQYQQNGFSGDSDAWAEMDATLVEEMVYDEVNDYYNYLGGSDDVFGAPGLTVIPGSYEDVTWAIYFHEKFGSTFWPETWSRIENSILDLKFLDAVKQELEDRSVDYTQTLQELYTWHFTSGSFKTTNFGFKESGFYPTPTFQSSVTQITDTYSNDISIARFAAHMTNVKPPSSQSGDVAVLMDTNSEDLSLSVIALFKDGSYSFEFAKEESGKWVVNKGWKWADVLRLGVVVLNEKTNGSGTFKLRFSNNYPTSIPIDETIPTTTILAQNYPNPFNPSTTIPVSISEFQKVKVDVYDITGRLVQSVFNGNLNAGNYELPVNMEKFASGIYLYRLKTNDNVMIKRMTLVK